MDHRITVAIIAVFGATLAFTFFVVSLSTNIKADGVVLAGAGDDDGGGGGGAAPAASPRDELVRVLQGLDVKTEQWRRDHGGRMPDFATYPIWEQFLQKTDRDGRPQPPGAAAPVPPYLHRLPVNPLNKLSSVAVVDGPLRPADRVPAHVGRAAFVYSTADRCFWGTNGSGRVVLTRGSETTPIQAPVPAPAPTPTTHPAASVPTTLPARLNEPAMD